MHQPAESTGREMKISWMRERRKLGGPNVNGAIDAAADEHAAAFDVHRANGVRKQHDGEDEPGSGLADVAFGFTARVIGGRGEVVQNDGGSFPEGNKGQ